jgi:hypothetical protein
MTVPSIVEAENLAADKRAAADLGAWIVFDDETGQSLSPPRSRTWGQREITRRPCPGGGTGHVSDADLACYHSGHRSRLTCRLRQYPAGTSCWSGATSTFICAGTALLHWIPAVAACVPAPALCPDLNPVGIWPVIKRGVLANLAVTSFAHLLQVVRRRLKMIQHQPVLIDGCFVGTSLMLHPDPTDITS